MTVLNNFTAPFGADAVAAMGIARKIHMVPMDATKGFAQGIMPLISCNYGSGNHRRMREVFFFALRISMGIIVAVAGASWLWSGELVTLFMKNPVIVAYGRRFLRGMSLGLPFLVMDFMALCVFQACGMGEKSLAFAVLRKILLEIPALLLLNSLFPLYGLAYAEFAAELVMTLASAVVLARIFRNPKAADSPEK